jgi:6-phospho-beta-glucosidase
MDPLKIAVIGGGSTYTPELVEGLLGGTVPVRQIALVDLDADKLAIVGGLAERMATNTPTRVTLHADRAPALDGADVVVTQLRVGGLAARVLDERIPLRHHTIGQETTGAGGFAKALRTIPVILDIDRDMADRCPDAWLVNFTNPSGIITEALRLHGRGRAVGLCNYPLTLKMKAAAALEVDESRVTLAYVGLNHLSWARVLVDGEDRTPALIAKMLADPILRELPGYAFAPAVLERLGMIPSGYLRYYYDTAKMLKEQQAAPQTRGERVQAVETELLRQYADPALREKPAGLQERGGAWYSTAAVRLIRDLWSPEGGTHVLNVPNGGAVPFLPETVIVETPARVAGGAITALPSVTLKRGVAYLADHPLPGDVEELIIRVKAYELYTVAAAVTGDRALARKALRAHPLIAKKPGAVPALLNELLEAHRAYLPRFF